MSSSAMLLLSTLFACTFLEAKNYEEIITDATVMFTPYVAEGGVDYWMYEFHADGTSVACNSNGNYYTPDYWIMDGDNGVTVYFGYEYEAYTFNAQASDLSYGTFTYQSSTGYQMEGDYEASQDYFPCSSR